MLKKNLLKRIEVNKNGLRYTHFHCVSRSSSSKKNKHVRFKNRSLKIPKNQKRRLLKILGNEK